MKAASFLLYSLEFDIVNGVKSIKLPEFLRQYFLDAEFESDMPSMLTPVNWDEVKIFFTQESKRLAQDKIGIKF